MRKILSERNVVVILFVMVLITFSLAQEDAKKMERKQAGVSEATAGTMMAERSAKLVNNVPVQEQPKKTK
ncbi:MAG: hypothetical protein IPH18_13660 [Chitinophagaceae bacterium]|nr:hypothetical protein [Chitinophagaceae bacterium]